MIPDGQKPEKISQQNQSPPEQLRGDESPAALVRESTWTACNEITRKLDHRGSAIGWCMQIEGKGWFGQVRDERGDWSFGPSSLNQARDAVETWLRHEVFDKCDAERERLRTVGFAARAAAETKPLPPREPENTPWEPSSPAKGDPDGE
jgi:hypothetical protein